MFKKLLTVLNKSASEEDRQQIIYRNILRDAAKMGGTVFGDVPLGTRREFFCLDEFTWVWHEEWTDEQGNYRVRTTRYDVRPQGIFKAQDGQPYRPLSSEETVRLHAAAKEYNRKLHEKFDPLLAASGAM